MFLEDSLVLVQPDNNDINLKERAYQLLQEDAERIACLLSVQLQNLKLPKCPLYEEVVDTHMFGLSREVDFAIRAGLITREQGAKVLHELEAKISVLDTLPEFNPLQVQSLNEEYGSE